LQERENEKSGTTTVIRIVAWVVNGREGGPVLEKRDLYRSEDGTMKPGKARGFSAADYWFILEHSNVIGPEMGVPTAKIATVLNTIQQEPVKFDAVDSVPIGGTEPF
jgi:hypothetical protein